ncbi:MAG: NADH-quinone oxidoreductase subunit NuoH [Gemmataceae bacterium]|nr:NADH-quinone oxidoreductase subunit NuoH [Gemmataceae bacterium]
MPPFDLTYLAITIVGLMGGVIGLVGYLTLAERKVSAWIQDRVGPNRVGPGGLLQPLADGGKFFLKEEVIPDHVDRVFYLLAPAVATITAFLAIAVVPFGSTVPAPDPQPTVAAFDDAQGKYRAHFTFAIAPGLEVGLLYVFALGSLAVYGVILAGWSANSKYSLLGSLRSSAQIISYEIPLGLSVLGVFLIVGSLNPEKIIDWQRERWWLVVFQPLAFLLFLVSVYAECARLPFDLPEAEQELVGGYHTEYSSMKLGLMLMAEYVHLVTTSFIVAIVFGGGWKLFGLESVTGSPVWDAVIRAAILIGKMVALVGFALVVRWTIPRFRFDQLMNLAWKVMMPLALLNLLCVMVVKQFGWNLFVLTATSVGLFLAAGFFSVKLSGSVTNPKRPVRKLPPGLPAGVTYASR